jgi:hypothetical protein
MKFDVKNVIKEMSLAGGFFHRLPPEILKIIMEFLPLKDKKKMRHLSRW